MKWGRILTAMATPFTEEGNMDIEGAKRLAAYLVENGSDGLVVAGTTGESSTLTREEKIALFRAVKETVGDRAPVIAGTGTNSTVASIDLTREAEKTGVDGIMLVTPYYNKPSQEGLYHHFKNVAAATSLPVILYNIPSRTGINLEAATTLRLSEIKNITAIKEGSGNMEQVTVILRQASTDFVVYSGDDSLTLPLMAVGAYGVISVASHIIGNRMQAMVKAFIAGNVVEAAKLHREMSAIFKVLFISSNPVPLKESLRIMGLPGGPVRPPLVGLNGVDKERLAKTMREMGLITLSHLR